MNFEEKLSEKMKKIGIELDDKQLEKFLIYKNKLLEWNEKINLTSITDEDDIILKHFVDSATVAKYIKKTDVIADIGTGAGFPGIPLEIIGGNKISLIDSLNKRIIFLQDIIKELNLNNANAIHARAEEIGHNKEHRGKYDIVTSRAVAKLNVLLEYMLPLTKVGGTCICLKGPNVKEEIEESNKAIDILGGKLTKIEEITLPDSDNARTLIFIECVKQSPNKYPRKPGTPSLLPI